ncbi:hypothetical protein FG064_16510 [Vibrio cholerae]|uniref:hypothetical protein n=1 Tax=Vibrio cholerae TaxID=666 RepID=UPI0011D6AB88|nr:hypothetical protein [Vibrio cholerae]EGR0468600.1 hypothetical protein [Vibrio cholerae]TXY52020.1 hypothetical protein FXE74_18695 [Vibrio cholerae]GIB34674.1 hypothetical protein VCSRO91_3570 [Vibrio cholerae]
MFKHGETYLAVERLIDSVWTVKFLFLKEGIRIISYSRENPDGYKNEKQLPKANIIEGDKRVAIAIQLYRPEAMLLGSDRETHLYGEYPVLNPQFIFSYSYKNDLL